VEKVKNARCDIELIATGSNAHHVERFLHQVQGLNAPPHDIVAACPCVIATDISTKMAQKLAHYLEKLDASVLLHVHSADADNASNNGHNSTVEEAPAENEPDSSTNLPAKIEPTVMPASLPSPPPAENHDAMPYHPPQQAGSRATSPPAIHLKRSVGELTHALQDKDWTVREHAVIELGNVPSAGVMRQIAHTLKDDVWRVRCTALHVLSLAGSDLALRDIARCVEDDVWHVRYQAVEALGRIESDKVVKPLLHALNDDNWQVRRRAVQLLGATQSKRVTAGLINCLKDEVWSVRERAAEALARLKSEKAVKALAACLRDSHWRVRSMVVTALKEIGSSYAIEALVAVLSDEHWMVHWKAAHALGRISDPAILPILTQLARENSPLLGEVAHDVLRSLDIVIEPRPHAQPRLTYRSETPPDNMRYIPAGEFLMGDPEGPDDAQPAQHVFLAEFFIDRYPVTNRQYALFDPGHQYAEGKDLFPVVNITWEDAQAYAVWLGKRLPSEAEWEKAARGEDARLYPWGDEFDSSRCNTEESGNRTLTAVNHYPSGESPYKVADLFGNVLEWTSDYYGPYAGNQDATPDFQEDFIVLRGSPWIHQGHRVNCATRSYAPADNMSNFIGFRCVKDVE